MKAQDYYIRLVAFFSRTTWVNQYRKGKTSIDLNDARDDGILGWQWHQLDHMHQSAPRSSQITTPAPHHSIFTGWRLFLMPSQKQCQSAEGSRIGTD